MIRLYREEKHIWRTVHTGEPVLLEKPIRKGWKRHFELREELKDKPDTEFFQTLLDKINTVTYARNKRFAPHKRRAWRESLLRYRQGLRTFGDYTFSGRHCPLTDGEKKYFTPVFTWRSKRPYIERYEFAEPWRFVLRIRPYYITHAVALDPSLQSRGAEIENYSTRNDLRHRMGKLLGERSNHKRCTVDRHPHPFKNKPFTYILDMYEKEKQYMAGSAEQKMI